MNYIKVFVAAIIIVFASCRLELTAQVKGNKNVIKKTFDVPSFNKIKAGGAFNIFITVGDIQNVEIETDENIMEKVRVVVENEELYVTVRNVTKTTKLNARVTVTELQRIQASGASDVDSESTITAEMFEIRASGASDLNLDLDVNTLSTKLSGASTALLTGKAENHSIVASGASTLKSANLVTGKTTVDASGASTIKVNATEELTGEISGSSDIVYTDEPPKVSIYRKSGSATGNGYDGWEDTTRVNVGGIDIEVIEGDSVKVRVGNKELVVDEDGHVRFQRRYKRKYNGHWAGFEMGFNGWVDNNFTMDFIGENEFMDLRMQNSLVYNINFFEQNLAITRNQKFGATTGLGITFNTHRFRRDTYLSTDSSYLIGYISDGVSIKKSKLNMMYLTIPVLFEYQTNSWHRKNSFHFGGGIIMAARLVSWTKIRYNETNKDYLLTRYNPETGQYEPELAATSPGRNKSTRSDDYFLQPVKFDATIRIGWGFINLWATYSINSMFRKNKGPELYPWSAGITIINF